MIMNDQMPPNPYKRPIAMRSELIDPREGGVCFRDGRWRERGDEGGGLSSFGESFLATN